MSMNAGAAAERRTVDEVAAVAANRRRFRVPTPQSADQWSGWLAIAVAVIFPLWFWGANWWNPAYTPVNAWVWGVPWIIATTYFTIQVMFLLVSSGHSDKIGMGDTVVSGIAFTSVLITFVVVVVRWLEGKYYLGGFQWNLLVSSLYTTLLELITTAWMRFLVNRRYFASVGSMGGSNMGTDQQ